MRNGRIASIVNEGLVARVFVKNGPKKRASLALFVMVGVLGVMWCLGAPESQATPSYYVSAEASGAYGVYDEVYELGNVWSLKNVNTGQLQQSSVSGSDIAGAHGARTDARIPAADASASYQFTASVTGLHATISALAETYLANMTAGASSGVYLKSFDTITVTSNTLPLGSPVSFDLTFNADGILSGHSPLSNTPGAAVDFFGPGVEIGFSFDNTLTTRQTMSQSVVANLVVGQTFSVYSDLFMNAGIGGSNSGTICSDIHGTPTLCDFGSQGVDLWNTAYFTITPLTPDVGYSAASGQSYTPISTVPEPFSLLLLGSGMVGLVAWRRKNEARRKKWVAHLEGSGQEAQHRLHQALSL